MIVRPVEPLETFSTMPKSKLGRRQDLKKQSQIINEIDMYIKKLIRINKWQKYIATSNFLSNIFLSLPFQCLVKEYNCQANY